MQNNSPLARAFRLTGNSVVLPYTLQGYKAPECRGQRYDGAHDGKGHAAYRLHKARLMVAEGKPIYGGAPGAKHYPNPADAFRFVGRVVPDAPRHWEDSRGDTGWHTDPYGDVFRDGSGLCYGVVYQLTGRDGFARFVAGYEFGGVDGGPTLDLTEIYTVAHEMDREGAAYYSGAVAAADNMAKAAAEKERDYQTAWRAGSQWAQAKEEADDARREALEVLAERRSAKGFNTGEHPALCRAIRGTVSELRGTITAARNKMEELASGNLQGLIFYPDDDAQAAFCEGAGIEAMPS